MSAPTALRMAPFNASREQPCGSPWTCAGVVSPGERGAYVGIEGGHLVVCAACREALENGATLDDPAGAPQPAGEPTAAPGNTVENPSLPEQNRVEQNGTASAADSWEATPAEALVLPPSAEMASTADLVPWTGPLCSCASRQSGFTRDVETGRWVHTECRRPALRFEDGRADTHAGQQAENLRAASPGPGADESAGNEPEVVQTDTSAQVSDSSGVDQSAGNQPGDAPKECPCARVTKRAALSLDDAGRPVHGNCGGVLREKHRHLAADLLAQNNANEPTDQEQPEEPNDDQSAGDGEPDRAERVDVGSDRAPASEQPEGPVERPDAGTGDDAADPAAGEPIGSADGALRPHEGRGGSDQEGARGADRRDQVRGAGGGPAVDGHGDPQPVAAHAAARAADLGDEAGHEGAQGGEPADLQPAREEVVQLEAGAPQVAAPTGGLAAFWNQPVEDDEGPTGTLAEFWAQPAEDEDVEVHPGWGAPVGVSDSLAEARVRTVHEPPDSDNYLGEFSVVELVGELRRRYSTLDGPTARVVALILDNGETIAVPR